jgi:hypothetical protein
VFVEPRSVATIHTLPPAIANRSIRCTDTEAGNLSGRNGSAIGAGNHSRERNGNNSGTPFVPATPRCKPTQTHIINIEQTHRSNPFTG